MLGTANAEIKVMHAATGKPLKKHKLANPVTALEVVLSGSLLCARPPSPPVQRRKKLRIVTLGIS